MSKQGVMCLCDEGGSGDRPEVDALLADMREKIETFFDQCATHQQLFDAIKAEYVAFRQWFADQGEFYEYLVHKEINAEVDSRIQALIGGCLGDFDEDGNNYNNKWRLKFTPELC